MSDWKRVLKEAFSLELSGPRAPPEPVPGPDNQLPRSPTPPPTETTTEIVGRAHAATRADNAEENAHLIATHRASFQLLATRGWSAVYAWLCINRLAAQGTRAAAKVLELAAAAEQNQERQFVQDVAPSDIDAPEEWYQVIITLRGRGFDPEYLSAMATVLDGELHPEDLQDVFEYRFPLPWGQLWWLYDWAPGLRSIFGTPVAFEGAPFGGEEGETETDDDDVEMGESGEDEINEDENMEVDDDEQEASSLPDYEPSPPTPAGAQSTRFSMATGFMIPSPEADNGSVNSNEHSSDEEQEAIEQEDPVASYYEDVLQGIYDQEAESLSGPSGDPDDSSDGSPDDPENDDDNQFNDETSGDDPIDDDEPSDDHSTGDDHSDNDTSNESDDDDDDERNAIHNHLVSTHSDANNAIVETYRSVFSVLAANAWTPQRAWQFVNWLRNSLPNATVAELINLVDEIDESQLSHEYTHTDEEKLIEEFNQDPDLGETLRLLYQDGFAVDYLREYAQELAEVGRPGIEIYDDLREREPREWMWEWAPALWEIWNDAGQADDPASTPRPQHSTASVQNGFSRSPRRSSSTTPPPGTQLYSPSYPPVRSGIFQYRSSPEGSGASRTARDSPSRSPTASDVARSYNLLQQRSPPPPARRSSLRPTPATPRNSVASYTPNSPPERALPGSRTSSELARLRGISPTSSQAEWLANRNHQRGSTPPAGSPDYAPFSPPLNPPLSSGLSAARSMSDPNASRLSGSGLGSRSGSASGSHPGPGSGSRRSSGQRTPPNPGSQRSSLPPRETSTSPASRPRGVVNRTSPGRRTPLVDPLRYTNRLTPPRRLPDTPTRSHRPPSPRRSGSRPRVCGECGRPYPRSSPVRPTTGSRTPSPGVRKTATPVIKDPNRPDGSSSPGVLINSPVKKAAVKKAAVKKAAVKKAAVKKAAVKKAAVKTAAVKKAAVKKAAVKKAAVKKAAVKKAAVKKAAVKTAAARPRRSVKAPDRLGG